MRNQLITGIYTWPTSLREVWTTLSLGKQPSAMACFTQENVADIMAWLATMAARVATTNTGQKRTSAHQNFHKTRQKNQQMEIYLTFMDHYKKNMIKLYGKLRVHLGQNHRKFSLLNLGFSSNTPLGPYMPEEGMEKLRR